MKGSVLTVNVIEARDLIPQDMNGLSDPYTVLTIEEQKIQTKYVPRNLNPIWNEAFTL